MRNIKKTFSLMLVLIMAITCTFSLGFALTDGDDSGDTAAGDGDDSKSVITNYLKENVQAVTDVSVISKDTWITSNFVTKAPSPDAVGYAVGDATIYLRKGIKESQAVQHIKSAESNAETVANMQDLTNGLNITADTAGATAIMSGFAPIISLVVGIIVTLVTVGMTIFSAFDIAYIAFPVFRNKCEEAKTSGGAMAKTTANGETKIRFVTDEAIYAVQECNIQNGKSPWAMYFKKRVLSYILLAIILFILMTGNISLITGIALKVVSGIMNVLSGLA